MVRRKILCLLVALASCNVDGKLEVVMDGGYEDCGSQYFDLSELEFITYNDTHIFLDGNLKVLRLIQAPWRIKISMEKFENNKWQPSVINRLIPEFCSTIQNPKEVHYHVTKNWVPKNCPYEAGTVIVFKMQQMNEFPFNFPPSLAGKWRINLEGWFFEGVGKKQGYDCKRFGCELVDI
ncbi:unnamed protein product [Diamesa tonsa]